LETLIKETPIIIHKTIKEDSTDTEEIVLTKIHQTYQDQANLMKHQETMVVSVPETKEVVLDLLEVLAVEILEEVVSVPEARLEEAV
jgi:hypothetical protein